MWPRPFHLSRWCPVVTFELKVERWPGNASQLLPKVLMFEFANRNKTVFEMWRLLRILFVIVILASAGVVGFAFLGDLSAPREQITKPVQIGKV